MDASYSEIAIEHFVALRYLSFAGAIVLVYDTLLTFPDVVHFVWPSMNFVLHCGKIAKANGSRSKSRKGMNALRPSQYIPKMIFVCMKVIMLCIALVSVIVLDPLRGRSTLWYWLFICPLILFDHRIRCERLLKIIGRIDVVVEIIASGIIIHRLYLLWNFGKFWSRVIIVSFTLMKGASFALAIIGIERMKAQYLDTSPAKACLITNTPKPFTLLAWVLGALYDMLTFGLFLTHALARPRLESEHLMSVMYRDGIMFFLATFSMRLLNVIVISIAQDAAIFWLGTVFSAEMVTVAASRSFLRLFYFGDPCHESNAEDCENCQWLIHEGGQESWCPHHSIASTRSMQFELSRVDH